MKFIFTDFGLLLTNREVHLSSSLIITTITWVTTQRVAKVHMEWWQSSLSLFSSISEEYWSYMQGSVDSTQWILPSNTKYKRGSHGEITEFTISMFSSKARMKWQILNGLNPSIFKPCQLFAITCLVWIIRHISLLLVLLINIMQTMDLFQDESMKTPSLNRRVISSCVTELDYISFIYLWPTLWGPTAIFWHHRFWRYCFIYLLS